jgi:L-2-hydroxyglutarate oxidase LhgO
MNEIKEKYIAEKIKEIKESVKRYGYEHISTCDAISYGWNKQDHLYMPSVAERLKADGYEVTREVRFGVVDYYIQ